MKSALQGRLFFLLAAGVVAASVLWGLLIIGSPEQQREKKFDEKRVADLQRIAGSIDRYFTRHKSLPENLDDLEKDPGIVIRKADPKTGTAYIYTKSSFDTYELCADFSAESADDLISSTWAHRAGKYCFQLTAKEVNNR
jgi:hypothetical protein